MNINVGDFTHFLTIYHNKITPSYGGFKGLWLSHLLSFFLVTESVKKILERKLSDHSR